MMTFSHGMDYPPSVIRTMLEPLTDLSQDVLPIVFYRLYLPNIKHG